MELVKTYDSAGNLSDKTYFETSQGELIKTSLEVGEELSGEPRGLNRVYFKIKEENEIILTNGKYQKGVAIKINGFGKNKEFYITRNQVNRVKREIKILDMKRENR